MTRYVTRYELSTVRSSIRGFYDPSVNFELEFDTVMEEAANDIELVDDETAIPPALPGPADNEAQADAAGDDSEAADKAGGAEVVSLDSFRKKS